MTFGTVEDPSGPGRSCRFEGFSGPVVGYEWLLDEPDDIATMFDDATLLMGMDRLDADVVSFRDVLIEWTQTNWISPELHHSLYGW